MLLGGLAILGVTVLLRGLGPQGADGDDEPSGLWRRSERGSEARARAAAQRRRIAELEALGYVDGSELPTTDLLVTIHDRERAWPGLNFYTSGHGGEAILLDMEGRVLHRWHSDFRTLWPDREYPARKDYWRRAVLLPDGHVIAIYAGRGILKLDRDSHVVWKSAVQAHHDLDVQPNGDIYLLTRRARVIPRIHPSEPVMEDFVLVLGPDGQRKRRVSVLESVERSEFMDLWPDDEAARMGDVFHTNSIEVLDGRFADRAQWLRAGNVLTSMRRLHTLAVIDLDRRAGRADVAGRLPRPARSACPGERQPAALRQPRQRGPFARDRVRPALAPSRLDLSRNGGVAVSLAVLWRRGTAAQRQHADHRVRPRARVRGHARG